MKTWICTAIGAVGSFIAYAFGGWDTAMISLIIFMAIDYITGIIVAALGRSRKSESGGLSSKIGFLGLAKKFMILLFVLIGYRLDLVIGTDYIRNAVIIGFMANELLSIIENAGLMGLPLPKVILNAVEILKEKSEMKKAEEEDDAKDRT